MFRFFSTLFLVLMVLLAPPAALAVVSNSAVPGDLTYPVKLKLEDGILILAALNPTTDAWFSLERAQRRYQETQTLIAEGKSATQSLDELVSQTDIAAKQVSSLQNPEQKAQYTQQLISSIQQYDQGLAQLDQTVKTVPVVSSSLSPSAAPNFSANPSAAPVVVVSPQPQASNVPHPSPSANQLKSTVPSPVVSTFPSFSPPPTIGSTGSQLTNEQKQILETRNKLMEIQKKLEMEQQHQNQKGPNPSNPPNQKH